MRQMASAESWLPRRGIANGQQGDVERTIRAPQHAFDECMGIRHERGIAGEEETLLVCFGEVHVRRATPAVDPVAIALVRRSLGVDADSTPCDCCAIPWGERLSVRIALSS